MELKEFIKTALADISKALKEVSDSTDESGLIINPEVSPYNKTNVFEKNGVNYPIYEIDFDIATTTEDSKAVTNKGGGNIKVVALSHDSISSQNSSNISRIKFSVPVVYPRPDDINKIKADPPIMVSGMI